MKKFVRATPALIASRKIAEPSTVQLQDPSQFKEKLQRMIDQGPENLLIISDFDYTLTQYKLGRSTCEAIFSLFTHEGLPGHLVSQLSANYHKYGPLELSVERTYEEKKELIDELYRLQLGLISGSGLTTATIQQLIDTCNIVFRGGFRDLIRTTSEAKVPLVILSGGITEIIHALVESVYANPLIKVYSNSMQFEGEQLTGFRPPIIHSYNKYEKTRDKFKNSASKNCLLLGDQRTDFYMDRESQFKNRMTVYLSKGESEDSKRAEKKFDALVGPDPSLEFPLAVLQCIISRSMQPFHQLQCLHK